jgi:CRP/FNR family transcriptional regulator, cyclic AMP receptor protein
VSWHLAILSANQIGVTAIEPQRDRSIFGRSFGVFALIFAPACEVDVKKDLSGIGVFKALPPDRIRAIEQNCEFRHFEPSQEIVGHLSTSRDVFFLVDGQARSIIYAASGTVVAFGEVIPGMMFGEIAAIDGEPRTMGIEAVAPTTVATLAPIHFLKLLRDEPDISFAVITQICRNIRGLTERVIEFSTLPVNNRVQAELLRLAETKGQPSGEAILLPNVPTHADFAARVSTHREAVTREINRLVKIGLLAKSDKGLAILDMAGLKALVQRANDA